MNRASVTKRRGRLLRTGVLWAALTAMLPLGWLLSGTALAEEEAVGFVGVDGYRLTLSDDHMSAETIIGDMCADAIRKAAGTDCALLPSGCIRRTLTYGEATASQIKDVFAVDESIVIAAVPASLLKAYLEGALSRIAIGPDERIDRAASAYAGFPQISGFQLRYDASAPVGSRVDEITINGSVLELSDTRTVYTLAAPVSAFDGSLALPELAYTESEASLCQALREHIASGGAETGPQGERIHVRGVADNLITGKLPVGILALILLVIVLAISLAVKQSLALGDMRERFGKPRTY